MNLNWAPLWSKVVNSSLWDESDCVVKVFMTMLALKDQEHVVKCNAYELGRQSRKTELEVLDALRILSSPDLKRIEMQEHQGRRIEVVPDGWLILNGAKYQELMQKEMKQARWRKAQAKKRERDRERERRNGIQPAAENKPTVMRQPTPEEQAAIDAQHEKTGTEVKKLNAMQKALQYDVEIDSAKCEQADAVAAQTKGEP